MAEREKRITVRVSESLHRKVKIKAAIAGKLVSDILREYLEEWTKDIDIHSEGKRKKDKPIE